MPIQAIFELIGDNPATILIVAGVLFILFGFMSDAANLVALSTLKWIGGIFIAIGIGLHLLWLRS